jgi:hypothetical protein
MAWQPYLTGLFAFSFYGKRKGLAKRKTRSPRHPCLGELHILAASMRRLVFCLHQYEEKKVIHLF